MDGVEIKGFKGEDQYQSGIYNGALTIRNAYLHDSNASVLNPQPTTTTTIENVHIANSWQWVEGLAGTSGIWRNILVENMAAGGNLAGGTLGPSVTVNGKTFGGQGNPRRTFSGAIPWLTMTNVIFSRVSGSIYLGSYIRGDVTLIDSTIGFDALSQWSAITDVDLRVSAKVDSKNMTAPFYFAGAPIGGSKPDQIDDIHIVANADATPAARSAGYKWLEPFYFGGGLGSHIIIENGNFEANRYPQQSTTSDHVPLQRSNRYLYGGDANNNYVYASAAVTISPETEVFFVNSAGSTGPYPISMATGSRYSDGQVVRLIAQNMPQTVTFATRGAGMTLQGVGGHQFTKSGEELDLKYDASAGTWREISY